MGQHRLAGDVAHRPDVRVGRAAALVHLDESARVEPARVSSRGPARRSPGGGRPRPARDRTSRYRPADVAPRTVSPTSARGPTSRAETDRREELLAPPGERLHEFTVHAGQESVGHLDECHLAARARRRPGPARDRCSRRRSPAAASGISGSSSAAVESMTRVAGRAPGRAAAPAREPVATMACLKRIFCGSSPSTRSAAPVLEHRAPADHLDVLAARHRGQAAGEPADHALALPLAQRIERDARLAEIDAELLGALGLAHHARPRAAAPWRGCSPRRGRRRPAACRRRPPRSPAPARRSGTPPSSRRARRR